MLCIIHALHSHDIFVHYPLNDVATRRTAAAIGLRKSWGRVWGMSHILILHAVYVRGTEEDLSNVARMRKL